MNYVNAFVLCLFLKVSLLAGAEFTISSYNCGGLSDHYDYLRAACMEKLVQERHVYEPEYMSLNEKIQKVALKLLFSPDPIDKALAQQEWDQKEYKKLSALITKAPTDQNSINRRWNQKSEKMITTYKVRPVVLHDRKVNQRLDRHLKDLSRESDLSRQEQLQVVRKTMAKRIFANHLHYDIICLQEADYLDPSVFPKNYEVVITENTSSKNGIAWKRDRFELVKPLGDILERACAVQLRDKQTGKIVLIASGHITGCNPFRVVKNPETGSLDSAKGDTEIQAIVDLFDSQEAHLKIIGMDSNVTSLHPRLHILKDADYQLDYENYLEPTCTNPYQVLNTRIDWICLKSKLQDASITNIPVLSVGLNNIQTNMSDHKPIAAKIRY